MKNLSLKLWSLLIAVALAYFVHGQGNRSVMTLIVPVEIQNLSSERIVLLPQSPQAQITIRGPSYVLSEVMRTPRSFKVRIPAEAGNRYSTPLLASALSLPPSIEILRTEPAEIEFVLDTLVEKKVSVEVPRIGSLQKDYRLEGLDVSPAQVTAIGPKTELESLKRISTQQIDLRAITADESLVLSLRAPGKFVRIKPDNVTVHVQVRAVTRERRFQNVPVVVLGKNLQAKWNPEPAKVSVELSGPRPLIQGLTKDDIQLFVEVPSVKGNGSKSLQLPVNARLPDRIDLVHIDPKIVRLRQSLLEKTATNIK